MWLSGLFSDRHKNNGKPQEERDPNINRGVYYLYLILFMQLFLVFGLLGGIMFIGSVISTPLWMLAMIFGLVAWGCIYVYRKIKLQLRKIRDAFQHADLSDRNYEISIMGGMLTMKVEQNPRRLLEAPTDNSPILDTEAIETSATRQA